MRWIVNKQITTKERNQFPQINLIILQLLFNRKLKTQKQIDEFLDPDYNQNVYDPFLFSGMNKTIKRIFSAIENQELIMVHGDYDADGICGSLILIETLEKLGAKTDIYIPDRAKEGYGLKEKAIDYINQKNKENKQEKGLIITVDCGIKSAEAVEYAQKNNIDVIITDHHIFDENLPKAFTVIHTGIGEALYPFKPLAGAGVAFKLAQVLLKEKQKMDDKFNFEGFEKWLLDLLAIATIADLVPMLGENKTLTKYGLVVLNKTKRIGLKKLIEISGFLPTSELTVYNVGFQLAPRINATGRLKNANTSYQLLKTKNEKEAEKIAKELDEINKKRQQIVEEIILQAINQIGIITNKQKILFALDKNWPEGVLGLVAGKLCQKFNRPTLIMTHKEENGQQLLIGSGRSNNFDLISALEKNKDILVSFGGHKCACGFKFLKNDLENFREKLIQIAKEEISNQDLIPILNIDQEIILSDITWELFNELKKFEPCGKENPQPKFLIKNLKIINLEKMGQEKQHLKLLVIDEKQKTIKMIGFGFGEKGDTLNINDKIDAIVEINFNKWNGNKELQLKIVDLKNS